MTFYDIPNGLIDEMKKYQELFLKGSTRTSTGYPTWTSTTSSTLYEVTDNSGENGLLLLLKTALRSYMPLATDFNGKAEISDLTSLSNALSTHTADYEYQTPVIVGTQIRIVKQSDTNILKFKLAADLTGGAITISLDAGASSKPLVDIDGVAVTSLDKGFVEVVENAVNFTYAPKGGKAIKGLIITPSTVNQAIPKGMHDGLGYVAGSANLLENNIRDGVNIFGKVGTVKEARTYTTSSFHSSIIKNSAVPISCPFDPDYYRVSIYNFVIPSTNSARKSYFTEWGRQQNYLFDPSSSSAPYGFFYGQDALQSNSSSYIGARINDWGGWVFNGSVYTNFVKFSASLTSVYIHFFAIKGL